jgi:hypothetical protein
VITILFSSVLVCSISILPKILPISPCLAGGLF